MVRTTLGAEVETSVSVSGSESVDFFNRKETDPVPDSTSDSLIIRPPSGSVYELLSFAVFIGGISGEGSSTHELRLQSESGNVQALRIQSSGDTLLRYARNMVISANITQQPSNGAAQALAPRGLRADDSNGYNVLYRNTTSSANTNSRFYKFWVREIQVAE